MLLFGDVLPFLQENVGVSPATRGKLITHPSKKIFLIVELAVVINIVKATYSLEGDGPLGFSCFAILSTVSAAVISQSFHHISQILTKLSSNCPLLILLWLLS